MKKIIPFLAGLFCIAACSQIIEDPAVETSERIKPTIIADSPSYSASSSTRTEIYTIDVGDNKEEIHTYWSPYDYLMVYNWVDGVTEEPGSSYYTDWSFCFNSDQPSQTAAFTLEDPYEPFEDATLVAIHPLNYNLFDQWYDQGSDGNYYGSFDYCLPEKQHPGAQTFDSDADLLISECFSFDPDNPIVDGLAFTRMNAIIKINFVDKTTGGLFDKMGINAVTFGPKDGNKYLTGWAYCFPHEEYYEMYSGYAYPYVSAEYSSNDHPCIGAIDAVYLLVHPTTLTGADYPDGLPVQVEVYDDDHAYLVTRFVTLPDGGIDLPAGLVTTLNISLWDDGVKGTTIVEKQGIVFADPLVESICLDYFDANKDGVLDTGEAARVTTLMVAEPSGGGGPKKTRSYDYVSPFARTGIESFDELRYFTGLESIEREAFAWCSNLSAITMPNSVTSIEENAFEGCSSLSSVTLPSSVTTIKEYAFNAAGLTTITIPDNVTTIEEGAFIWCTSLTSFQGKFAYLDGKYLICNGTLIAIAIPSFQGAYSIPDDLDIAKIGAYVFMGRGDLTNVTIPAGVQSIGLGAFSNCSYLTTVTLPESILELAQEAFCWCESLRNINFPSDLSTIGALAFQDCHALTSITLPGKVTYMGNHAFLRCTGLQSVTLGDGMTDTGSGGRVFGECTGLKTVSFPNTLTTVSYESFQNCTALEEITIPASVTKLEAMAFQYCTELKTVILKPTTPPELQNNVFNNTSSSLEITVPASSLDAYKEAWQEYASIIK